MSERIRFKVRTGELMASSSQSRFVKKDNNPKVLYREGMFGNKILAKV